MSILNKYAKLLVEYSLDIQRGEKLYISSTTLAEPLVREVYREAVKMGALVEVELDFHGKSRIFFEHANTEQLQQIPILQQHAMQYFDAYLVIRAPFNLKENHNIDPKKRIKRSKAIRAIAQNYHKRTSNGKLKRSLCQYPTIANAQHADMAFEEYEHFVYNACHLYDADPKAEWLQIRKKQQKIVDFLNKKHTIRYVNKNTNISFSVKGRIWINSDGRTNMPSGEVFTGPVEDSVEGEIFFDYASIYRGKEVEGIRLRVEKGRVVDWSAQKGKTTLDAVFTEKGSRYFGEVAIGTNYNILKATKNILFDEKIGGTVHMAVGQSYGHSGGKNQSNIHWDMIADMRSGEIFADDELIYKNGKFTIF